MYTYTYIYIRTYVCTCECARVFVRTHHPTAFSGHVENQRKFARGISHFRNPIRIDSVLTAILFNVVYIF
jgi:hypothetical protein